MHPLRVHLDAWNLSLITGLPCLNGYSAISPRLYGKFLSSPTRENALELIKNCNLRKENIAILESRAPEFEKKYPLIRYDLSGVRINTDLQYFEGFCGQEVLFECKIFNPSNLNIPASKLSFYPSYRLYYPSGKLVEDSEPLRTPIEVLPGDKTISYQLKIQMPRDAGEYILKPSFVKEHVEWKVDVLPKEEVSSVKLTVHQKG